MTLVLDGTPSSGGPRCLRSRGAGVFLEGLTVVVPSAPFSAVSASLWSEAAEINSTRVSYLASECMDHVFMRNLKGSVSCIDFKGDIPLRCLDLGTGVSLSRPG